MGVPGTGCSLGSCLGLGKQTQGCQENLGPCPHARLVRKLPWEPGETQGRVWSGAGLKFGKWPRAPHPLPCSTPCCYKRAATPGLPGMGEWLSGEPQEPSPESVSAGRRRPSGVRTPASVSPVSPQVQVLLYYLQHPPISFAELKRNTLYFSTDV